MHCVFGFENRADKSFEASELNPVSLQCLSNFSPAKLTKQVMALNISVQQMSNSICIGLCHDVFSLLHAAIGHHYHLFL